MTEITLFGAVGGGGFFDDDGFSAAYAVTELAKAGRDNDVTIRLNSGGGVATEGAAIYAALKDHKGKVTVQIEGVAASAASLIAMAGDEIVMTPGAIMMIHDPLTMTFGNADAHGKAIEALNVLGQSYAGIYAERSGKTVDEARAIMKATTWLSAEDAVAQGFATRSSASNDNTVIEPTAFAYQLYAQAPAPLVALANARGWQARAHLAVAAASSRQQKEPTMTVKDPAANPPQDPALPNADDAAAAIARAAEIATLCATAGVPLLAAALIKDGSTVVEAQARIVAAGEIRDMVAKASKVAPAITAAMADDFIAAGTAKDAVAAALFDQLVARQSPEVSPHVAVDTQAAADGWNKAVETINARK